MEKFDLTKLNNLIKETSKLIDNDPLTQSVEEVWLIKKQFDSLQDAIQSQDKEKSKWFLTTFFNSIAKRDEWFQMKSFEWKINSIFSQFDLVHESIQNTIEMYEKYSVWLELEINALTDYLTAIDKETLEQKDLQVISHYEVMLDTLNLSLQRIKLSLVSATDLELTMENTRPIFQAVLSSCLIEVGWQRTSDSSIQMIQILQGTIESMSTKLTESAVSTSKLAYNITTRPLLDTGKLQNNMLALWNALQDIEDKKQLLLSN